jgi:hypothetical protein
VIIRYFEESPQRRAYAWAAGVLLVFLAINGWVAFDHLRIERRTNRETVDSLGGTRLLAEQRAALLGARPDNGPIDLPMMRKAGIRVPDSFVHAGHFASPWGASQITRDGDQLVWDFYEITTAGCTQLLTGAIPGVIRAAASAGAADEKKAPLRHEVAVLECRRAPLMARLILK